MVANQANHRIPHSPIRESIGTPESPQSAHENLWNWILFAALMLWTFVGLCFPMLDTDFWWHLKTGDWILEHGTVPYIDLYTYTDSDKAWIDLHWGFQLLITILYRMGGIPLVTLVKAATITAAVAVAWKAGGPNLPAWKKAAIWILPIICIAGRGNERPEMLSQLFLAMWLWIARKTDERPKLIWWLVPLQLVWVNCHALFILGLVVGFCFFVDVVLRLIAKGRFGLEPRPIGPGLQVICLVGGLVGAACFVNPYLEQGALFPLTLFRKFSVEKDFYSKNIGEFRPPIDFVLKYGLSNLYLQAELGMWLIAVASFIRLMWVERKWSPFRLLLFAGFSHLAWQASRNTNIFSIVSGVVACENFASGVIDRAKARLTKRSSNQIEMTYGMTGLVTCLIALVVTGTWNQLTEKNKPFGLGESPNWFIHDAAKFAAQPGFPEKAFVANIGQADVYVYHNWPERKVFMDARLEVCTQQTFRKLNDALDAMANGSPRWQAIYRDDELPVVILDSRNCRAAINGMLMTPTWRLVYADPAAAVFLPLGLANKLNLPPANPTPLIYPDGPPKSKKS